MQFIKEHFIVILAFALPIVFVLVVAFYAGAPARSVPTAHSFVYATCSEPYVYRCGEYVRAQFDIVDYPKYPATPGEDRPAGHPNNLRFYRYDPSEQHAVEIDEATAQSLVADGGRVSPDGFQFEMTYGSSVDVFPIFFDRSRYQYVLTKGDERYVLDMPDEQTRIYDGLFFIGWVVE